MQSTLDKSRKLRQRLELKYYVKLVRTQAAEDSDLDLLCDPP